MDSKEVFSCHHIDNTPEFSFNGRETVCRLVEIYDGDTAIVIFEFNKSFIKLTVRMCGINAPEIRTLDLEEKARGYLARQKFIDLACHDDHPLTVDSSRNEVQEYLKDNVVLGWLKCYRFEKYGRLLGSVFAYKNNEIGVDIGDVLLSSGHAEIYQK